jgi:hypothetical protein
MRQQGREHLIRSSDKLACLGQQLAIRKVGQPGIAPRNQLHDYVVRPRARVHVLTLHPRFSTFSAAPWRAFQARVDPKGISGLKSVPPRTREGRKSWM